MASPSPHIMLMAESTIQPPLPPSSSFAVTEEEAEDVDADLLPADVASFPFSRSPPTSMKSAMAAAAASVDWFPARLRTSPTRSLAVACASGVNSGSLCAAVPDAHGANTWQKSGNIARRRTSFSASVRGCGGQRNSAKSLRRWLRPRRSWGSFLGGGWDGRGGAEEEEAEAASAPPEAPPEAPEASPPLLSPSLPPALSASAAPPPGSSPASWLAVEPWDRILRMIFMVWLAPVAPGSLGGRTLPPAVAEVHQCPSLSDS